LKDRTHSSKDLSITVDEPPPQSLAPEKRQCAGQLVDLEARDIPADASFLEMLDLVNEDLIGKGEEPIAFDHDCREGICGTCSLTINGIAHGPSETTTCQLYMRKFKDGETIYDRAVSRKAVSRDPRFDCRSQRLRAHPASWRIHQCAHGCGTGRKCFADRETNGGRGDGSCRVHRLRRVRGGLPERFGDALRRREGDAPRVAAAGPARAHAARLDMVRTMDAEGFGNCSNYYECEAVCPPKSQQR
jgi:succinate dehydrogenase / fumarate reductase iron-sulfur subunit